jgi:hypothetical protein
MVWFKPRVLYKDCPDGNSFELSSDNPLIAIDTNLLPTGKSAANSSSVPRTANHRTSTGAGSLAPTKRVKPRRASSSSAPKSNNKAKKVKKERTPLSFFSGRKTKERTGGFPLADQSNNQKVRIVQYSEANAM